MQTLPAFPRVLALFAPFVVLGALACSSEPPGEDAGRDSGAADAATDAMRDAAADAMDSSQDADAPETAPDAPDASVDATSDAPTDAELDPSCELNEACTDHNPCTADYQCDSGCQSRTTTAYAGSEFELRVEGVLGRTDFGNTAFTVEETCDGGLLVGGLHPRLDDGSGKSGGILARVSPEGSLMWVKNFHINAERPEGSTQEVRSIHHIARLQWDRYALIGAGRGGPAILIVNEDGVVLEEHFQLGPSECNALGGDAVDDGGFVIACMYGRDDDAGLGRGVGLVRVSEAFDVEWITPRYEDCVTPRGAVARGSDFFAVSGQWENGKGFCFQAVDADGALIANELDRWTPDGVPDETYTNKGKISLIDDDGRYVTTGMLGSGGLGLHIIDPAAPSTPVYYGRLSLTGEGAGDRMSGYPRAIALAEDGSYILAGRYTNAGSLDFGFVEVQWEPGAEPTRTDARFFGDAMTGDVAVDVIVSRDQERIVMVGMIGTPDTGGEVGDFVSTADTFIVSTAR